MEIEPRRIELRSQHARIERPFTAEMLEVLCWCQARVVAVSRSDVRAGMTLSCGRRRCRCPGER